MATRVNVVHPVVQVLLAVAALVAIGAGLYASLALMHISRDVSRLGQRFDRAASGLDVVSRMAAQLERTVAPAGKGEPLSRVERQLQLSYGQMQQTNQKLDTMNGQLAAVNGNLLALRAGAGRMPPRR